MAEKKWDRAVIKPTVSASSDGTRVTASPSLPPAARAAAQAHDQTFLEQHLKLHNMVVQEFLPEVTNPGEWSLVHFNGVFSHATRKSPNNVDTNDLTHSWTVATPPAHLMLFAHQVLSFVPAESKTGNRRLTFVLFPLVITAQTFSLLVVQMQLCFRCRYARVVCTRGWTSSIEGEKAFCANSKSLNPISNSPPLTHSASLKPSQNG
jgi:hypothetical protein